jgi:hypothetical protein
MPRHPEIHNEHGQARLIAPKRLQVVAARTSQSLWLLMHYVGTVHLTRQSEIVGVTLKCTACTEL